MEQELVPVVVQAPVFHFTAVGLRRHFLVAAIIMLIGKEGSGGGFLSRSGLFVEYPVGSVGSIHNRTVVFSDNAQRSHGRCRAVGRGIRSDLLFSGLVVIAQFWCAAIGCNPHGQNCFRKTEILPSIADSVCHSFLYPGRGHDIGFAVFCAVWNK